ncbi:hypothetical protein Ddc_04489 [Ditylenchus destructor]|nr:hypothetical protein Ddc_04489 [Ditylenchus destructor]
MNEIWKSNSVVLWLISLLLACLIGQNFAQESQRLIDVRKIIKGALDVIRTYPAPTALLQPLTPASPAPTPPATAVPLPIAPSQPYQSSMNQNALPSPQSLNGQARESANKIPVHSHYMAYTPSNQYNGYPSTTYLDPSVQPVRKIFAEPTETDMEKLFHLPADIIQRLAADAGYIEKDSDSVSEYMKYFINGQKRAESRTESKPDSAFSFGIQDNSKAFNFNGKPDLTTTTAPVIIAAGNPRIHMRTVNREGKLFQVPVVAIPQSNGEVTYLPFERLSDLSEALSKLVSTGQISVDEIVGSKTNNSSSNPKEHSNAKLSKPNPVNPLIDNASDAIATNQVPSQAMRKIFPVKDVVYPSNPGSESDSNDNKPEEHIMTEPTTTLSTTIVQSMSTITTKAEPGTTAKVEEKRVVMTESKAFVQELDSDTVDKEDNAKMKGSQDELVTRTTIKAVEEEIVLNGKRYKLVADTSNASTNDPSNTLADALSRMLKTTPTQIPKNGPIPVDSDTIRQQIPGWVTSTNNEMVPFSEAVPVTQIPHKQATFKISQQEKMPTLPQERDLRFRPLRPEDIVNGKVLVEKGANTVRNGMGTVQIGEESARYGMNTVRSGMNLVGAQEEPAQVFYDTNGHPYPLSGVNVQSHAIMTTTTTPYPTPVPTSIYPVYPAASLPNAVENSPPRHQHLKGLSLFSRPALPISSLEPMTTTTTELPVKKITEKQTYLVNNGGSHPVLINKISSSEMRRKEDLYPQVDPQQQIPFRRQYSLKELEEFYSVQKNKLNKIVEKMKESKSHPLTKSYPQQRQIKIGLTRNSEEIRRKEADHLENGVEDVRRLSIQNIPSSVDNSAERKLSRLEKLRRQFARERAMVARKTKRMFLSKINHTNQGKLDGKATEQHCLNIRSLARQYGTMDVEYFAKNNCRFIETYYPDLKCSKVNEYVAECQKYI